MTYQRPRGSPCLTPARSLGWSPHHEWQIHLAARHARDEATRCDRAPQAACVARLHREEVLTTRHEVQACACDGGRCGACPVGDIGAIRRTAKRVTIERNRRIGIRGGPTRSSGGRAVEAQVNGKVRH